MRPQPPTNRNARNEPFVVAGHFYDKGQTDRYIASLKRRGIRGWQEARANRKAERWWIGTIERISEQHVRMESERDEVVALLRAAKDNDFTCPDDQKVDAFLIRIGGTE